MPNSIVKLTHAARDIHEEIYIELRNVVLNPSGIEGVTADEGDRLFIPWTSVAWVSES